MAEAGSATGSALGAGRGAGGGVRWQAQPRQAKRPKTRRRIGPVLSPSRADKPSSVDAVRSATDRLLPPLLLACALLGGCERMRDVKRCRQLAERVNARLDAVEREAARGDKDVDYGKLSKEYSALAKGLADFDGGAPDLARTVEEFEVLSRNAARHAQLLDQALESDNAASATLAKRELERLARQEKSIAARIDDECRPK